MKHKISKKHRLLHRLFIVAILMIILPLAYNFLPIASKGNPTFYLPSSSNESLIHTLKSHGYTVSFLDTLMLKAFAPPTKGWYHISDIPSKRWEFFKKLGASQSKAIRVKIYAGENTTELIQRLANDMKCNPNTLLKAYRSHSKYVSGDILSGFYQMSRKANEESIIHALYAQSNKKLKKFTQRYCQSKPNALEFKILLIIASIIQKESNNPKEMPLISSVIENRLEKGMRLQMDSTLNYGKYSHKAITSLRIKKDKTYYNTYKYSGIPPSPLCTVSVHALEAALNPSQTKYLYFMLNSKGTHDFASSYEAHKKNIRAFRKTLSTKVKLLRKDTNTSSSKKPKAVQTFKEEKEKI